MTPCNMICVTGANGQKNGCPYKVRRGESNVRKEKKCGRLCLCLQNPHARRLNLYTHLFDALQPVVGLLDVPVHGW